MKVVRAHKGKLSYRCHVRGFEAHSSLSHVGVNAVEAAAKAVAYLKSMARRHRDQGPFDPELVPPYTTVHTGTIHGGMPAVVCGPGSIDQAHKPDEFIARDQIRQCETLLRKLFERCWKGSV